MTRSIPGGALTPYQVGRNSPSGISHRIGVPVSTVTVYAATENSGMQKHGASERERDPSVWFTRAAEVLSKNYDLIEGTHTSLYRFVYKNALSWLSTRWVRRKICMFNAHINHYVLLFLKLDVVLVIIHPDWVWRNISTEDGITQTANNIILVCKVIINLLPRTFSHLNLCYFFLSKLNRSNVQHKGWYISVTLFSFRFVELMKMYRSFP